MKKTLLLATILRLYHLDFQSLWMDELYTMNVSNPKLSWLEFHKQMLKREGFPHLYFYSNPKVAKRFVKMLNEIEMTPLQLKMKLHH